MPLIPIPMSIFYIAGGFIALMWALVIGIAVFNVLSAIKGKKKNGDKKTTPTAASTRPSPAPDATPTIAGMPLGTYYATLNDWTNTTTLF